MQMVRVITIAVVLLAATVCQARDLAIVVNKSNVTAKVSAAELEKLLKATTSSWPDGKKVKVFLTDPGAADNRTILQRVYKMAPAEIKSLVDAHKADIQIVASDDIVLTMVGENPGAIGIVNVYSITSQVRVLKVDEKLPMEQGYLLHGN
jgi:ABC-type phosphate transport system substrate-binding protein